LRKRGMIIPAMNLQSWAFIRGVQLSPEFRTTMLVSHFQPLQDRFSYLSFN
jgi:hypothetical protein